MIQSIIIFSIISIISGLLGVHPFNIDNSDQSTPIANNIKCEDGMHGELVDLSWNPVLEQENIFNVCIPNTINAQFVHDWYNSGCLWTSHTEWADNIKKVKLVNGTILVCNKFEGFMTQDNKYGYQQWGETGDQYVKSECNDLTTEVDDQCYNMINTNPHSFLNTLKNSTMTIMNTTTVNEIPNLRSEK